MEGGDESTELWRPFSRHKKFKKNLSIHMFSKREVYVGGDTSMGNSVS